MKMKSVKSSFFKEGVNFPFKVYFQISESKMLVLFNENTVLEQEDLDKITHYISENKKILISKDDYAKYFASKLKSGSLDVEDTKEVAFHILEREKLGDEDYFHSVIADTNNIIKHIAEENQGPQSSFLLNLLKEMESTENEFMIHANQLFALSTTFLFLATGESSIEDIYDLGHGALLHGFALNYMNDSTDSTFSKTFLQSVEKFKLKSDYLELEKVVTLHLNGHSLKTFDDITIYLESFDIMEIASNSVKETLSNGAPKLIHDFKMLQIPKVIGLGKCKDPSLTARILLIADHVLSNLRISVASHPSDVTDSIFSDCLEALRSRVKQDKNSPEYDFDIVIDLLTHFNSQETLWASNQQ